MGVKMAISYHPKDCMEAMLRGLKDDGRGFPETRHGIERTMISRPERTALHLKMRGVTFDGIGETLGLSRERARQLYVRAVWRIAERYGVDREMSLWLIACLSRHRYGIRASGRGHRAMRPSEPRRVAALTLALRTCPRSPCISSSTGSASGR
jgi:hypothetical protein